MCGRFTLTVDPAQFQEAFPGVDIDPEPAPRYNIAPTQPVAVIPNNAKDKLDYFVWGLIPSWAKDPSIGSRLINARADTLAQKPSFRSAYRRRRCLIPASGFYEWKPEPGSKSKTPMYITLASGKPFAFAGLWEFWQSLRRITGTFLHHYHHRAQRADGGNPQSHAGHPACRSLFALA